MTEQEIKDRLSELYAKQAAATGWGAAVGARHEEIKSLEGQLAALRRPSTGIARPLNEELLYLADQQAYARSRYAEDDTGLIRESKVLEWALRTAAQAQRITGACNEVEEAACLIWAELCPGMVMGDSDLPHYEAAAKAVLALRAAYASIDREAIEKLIQRHASAYVARGGALSDSIIAECKASREALLAALSPVSSTPHATPVMQAAEKAAKVVEGWSEAKKDYADRVTAPHSSPNREGGQ